MKKGLRTGRNYSTYFTWLSILSNFSGLFREKKHPSCMRMNLKLFPFYGGGRILFLSSPYSIIWQWCRCFYDKSAEGFSEFLGSFFKVVNLSESIVLDVSPTVQNMRPGRGFGSFKQFPGFFPVDFGVYTVKRPILKSSLMRQIAPLEYINTLLKRAIPKKPR